MFESTKSPVIENMEENKAICRKYCTIYQNYKKHDLNRNEPKELFCAQGPTSCQNMKEIGCFCPACELFAQHHMALGHFCTQR